VEAISLCTAESTSCLRGARERRWQRRAQRRRPSHVRCVSKKTTRIFRERAVGLECGWGPRAGSSPVMVGRRRPYYRADTRIVGMPDAAPQHLPDPRGPRRGRNGPRKTGGAGKGSVAAGGNGTVKRRRRRRNKSVEEAWRSLSVYSFWLSRKALGPEVGEKVPPLAEVAEAEGVHPSWFRRQTKKLIERGTLARKPGSGRRALVTRQMEHALIDFTKRCALCWSYRKGAATLNPVWGSKSQLHRYVKKNWSVGRPKPRPKLTAAQREERVEYATMHVGHSINCMAALDEKLFRTWSKGGLKKWPAWWSEEKVLELAGLFTSDRHKVSVPSAPPALLLERHSVISPCFRRTAAHRFRA